MADYPNVPIRRHGRQTIRNFVQRIRSDFRNNNDAKLSAFVTTVSSTLPGAFPVRPFPDLVARQAFAVCRMAIRAARREQNRRILAAL